MEETNRDEPIISTEHNQTTDATMPAQSVKDIFDLALEKAREVGKKYSDPEAIQIENDPA